MEKPSFDQLFDIAETASYILRNGYTRVALQFPDHLLRVSVSVASALKNELRKQSQPHMLVRLYVLADTTYGSCCADEIAAAHVQAECIIHYGHTCLSLMSKLPVRYVLGKSVIDMENFVHQLVNHAVDSKKRILVLFDLAYAHAIPEIQDVVRSKLRLGMDSAKIIFAEVPEREAYPLTCTDDSTYNPEKSDCTKLESDGDKQISSNSGTQSSAKFSLGGLSWNLPRGCKMEDIELIWIGQEGPALTNIMLTFNALTVIPYDPERKLLITNLTRQSNSLMRRYYLVERAKDANIVGIVIGTLGVAGYREMVQKLHKLVKESGRKPYILAMGKPNPAKLANFPECDIFVLVACAQSALLDSKEYMVPVITPFEAMIAWKRGKQWNGDYSLDFSLLRDYSESDGRADEASQLQNDTEARFSFITGSYVEEQGTKLTDEKDYSRSLSLAREVEHALKLQDGRNTELCTRPEVKSGVEFFALRSFQGLQQAAIDEPTPVQSYAIGQKGRAAGYSSEPAGLK